MRAAQSRLGIVSSLDDARRDMGRCVDLLPVSARMFRLGVGVAAGLAGVVVLRSLWPARRRKPAPAPAAVVRGAAAPGHGAVRYLLSQSLALLLIPLCRYYFLGEKSPVAARLAPMIDRVFRKAN